MDRTHHILSGRRLREFQGRSIGCVGRTTQQTWATWGTWYPLNLPTPLPAFVVMGQKGHRFEAAKICNDGKDIILIALMKMITVTMENNDIGKDDTDDSDQKIIAMK